MKRCENVGDYVKFYAEADLPYSGNLTDMCDGVTAYIHKRNIEVLDSYDSDINRNHLVVQVADYVILNSTGILIKSRTGITTEDLLDSHLREIEHNHMDNV